MGPTFLRNAKGLLRVAEKFVWVWNQMFVKIPRGILLVAERFVEHHAYT